MICRVKAVGLLGFANDMVLPSSWFPKHYGFVVFLFLFTYLFIFYNSCKFMITRKLNLFILLMHLDTSLHGFHIAQARYDYPNLQVRSRFLFCLWVFKHYVVEDVPHHHMRDYGYHNDWPLA